MSEIIVIKIGGRASQSLSQAMLEQMKQWQDQGKQLVLVHGGGFAIQDELDKAHIPNQVVHGLRVTTKEALPYIKKALCESVGQSIAKQLASVGLEVVAANDQLAEIVQADYIDKAVYGYVGEAVGIQTTLLDQWCQAKKIPLLASLGYTTDGQLLNINADYLAMAVAESLAAQELILLTDVDGVCENGQTLANLTPQQISAKITDGVITGGMIPKVTSAVKTLEAGVSRVRIAKDLIGGSIIQKGE